MEDRNFYAVTTKCGHVGRKHYLPVTFPVVAKSGKEAALIGRKTPRVKHQHKDAILNVRKISYDEYLLLVNDNKNNLYLKCKSKQEQNEICIGLFELLIEDDHNKKVFYSKELWKERIEHKKKKNKELLYSYKFDKFYVIA